MGSLLSGSFNFFWSSDCFRQILSFFRTSVQEEFSKNKSYNQHWSTVKRCSSYGFGIEHVERYLDATKSSLCRFLQIKS